MKKLVIFEWISLDGVFDATSMDQWYFPFDSTDRQQYITRMLHSSDAFLMGRKTYEMLAPYWSAQQNNEMGVADKLNQTTKYVVSSSLQKGTWNNSVIVQSDAMGEIARLKQEGEGQILLMGSAELVAGLAAAGLVDEYNLLVHPAIVGSGLRLFRDGMQDKGMRTVATETLANGVVALRYNKV